MMWPWKYMMRVEGLGEVKALFLASAKDDDEARADMQTTLTSDRRVKVLALYRIICLLDEVDDPEVPHLSTTEQARAGAATYLLTGISGSDKGQIQNLFFQAPSPQE